MNIIMPDLNIEDNSGFDPKFDIFNRKEFGERLARLIETSGGNPVIALDSNWGEGKSTFIKMWRGYIEHKRESKLTSIYFDAFENDYQKEPFLALATEVYKLILDDDAESKAKFQDAAVKAMKSICRGSLKLMVKVATSGIIGDDLIDSVKKDVSALVSDQVDDIFKQKFQHAEEDKKALTVFKEYLSSFAREIGNGKPIVFIIDELDRCRPDFALELLENIKHLFSVPGITFLLVTNRKQLESSINVRYGAGVDASNYLHKFVNVWLTMPRDSTVNRDLGCIYLDYALRAINNNSINVVNSESVRFLNDLIKCFQPSFREIERILSYFAVVMNMLDTTKCLLNYQCVIALVSYLKACKPESLKLINGRLDRDVFLSAVNLDKLSKDGKHTLTYMCVMIEFEFADENQRSEIIESGRIKPDNFGDYPDKIIHEINGWVNGISLP